MLAAITAGASLGFLRHGFPPASSFMGDTGSNLLGYLLATIAVQGSLKTNAALALPLPLIVLAVPILDTSFVVAKRLKYRQPIYQADRWHFHHRMANIGFSQRRTLKYLYGWTLIAGRARAGAALRPLQRRPRQLRPVLDGGDGPAPARGAGRQRLRDLRARDPEAAPVPAARAARSRAAPGPEPSPVEREVDEEVKRELDTGEFAAVNPKGERRGSPSRAGFATPKNG